MSQSLDSRAWSQRDERVLKGAEGVGQGGSREEGHLHTARERRKE